ncbi:MULTISPECIES: DUF6966 domain-containing protein [unclassified Pseudomonas]|uniref:DUF6966 domain-containing protein n=1 Tax=unclassified Pseudomonas TaxID=196821 RepID=UPI003FA73FAF
MHIRALNIADHFPGPEQKGGRPLPQDTAYALFHLISLYGGMGSINDVVLYENAKPLLDENNELQGLLSDLHQLCAGSH